MNEVTEAQREVVEEFSFFDNWMDRYQYLIDLGRRLPALDESERIDENLIALLLRIYSEKTPEDILTSSPDFIAELELEKHLSATRSNGLASMLKAIRQFASDAAA